MQHQQNPYRVRLWSVVCSALLCCGVGCASMGTLRWEGAAARNPVASLKNPVTQIIPTWQEAEGPGITAETVSRGFQGQIYFITAEKGLPAEVDGKVRVYVFDDQGAHDDRVKPIHQFDFEPGAWKLHLVQTKLGPAYSVFVPYTRAGRFKSNCVLRIKFIPTEGATVYSQMVNVELSGFDKSVALSQGETTSPPRNKVERTHKVVRTDLGTAEEELEDGITQASFEDGAQQQSVQHTGHRSAPQPDQRHNPLNQPVESRNASIRTYTIPLH